MKETTKLTLQMSILFLIVFVVFGVTIVNEKLSPLKIPKVTEKITQYINSTYKDILNDIEIQEVEYKELKYQTKIINKNNQNYYFYVYYQDKKLSDTYKDDYLKGKSILNYQKDNIVKNIKNKTKSTYKITMNKTLDKYTENMKEKILTSDKPESLKIYNLESNITVSKFDSKNISSTIKSLNDNFNNKNIIPKSYTFIVTDTEKEDLAIKISNITSETINSNDFINIINDIINNKKSNLINTYKIEYEYLN